MFLRTWVRLEDNDVGGMKNIHKNGVEVSIPGRRNLIKSYQVLTVLVPEKNTQDSVQSINTVKQRDINFLDTSNATGYAVPRTMLSVFSQTPQRMDEKEHW